ncbi:MAG TPA: hypothetical protein DCE39_08300, partial [Planctomycetaceae bacterium]|nr:hypothetical protein [Planctomycetaceae bacterium]
MPTSFFTSTETCACPPLRRTPQTVTRRTFFHDLYGLGASLGSIALTSMLSSTRAASRRPHVSPVRAKQCIFLYMEGGPSHLDTFDPKPRLSSLHLKEFQRGGEEQSAMSS